MLGSRFVRIIPALPTRPLMKAALLAAAVTLCSADLLEDAVANGDTRTLSFHHVHSGVSATITFKKDGRYVPSALKQLNVLMQDWRLKEPTNMDPRLFDIIWEVYRDVDASRPIEVIGGYRSPRTNAMLRQRSRGVAKTSLHMQGKAMDFFIPGVPLEKIREAGLRLQRGGVGFYPTSGSPFVHLDTGGIRHWPRMTRSQLARVFPDGKTVHIPADGKPMSGYQVALAEVEARGKEPGGAGASFAGLAATNNPKPRKNLLASLFGKDDEDDDADSGAPAPVVTASATPAAATPAAEAPASQAEASEAPASVALASAAPIPMPVPNPLPRLAMAAPAVPMDKPAAPVLAAAVPSAMPKPAPTPAPGVDPSLAALAAAVPLPEATRAAPMVVASAAPVPLPLARPVEADGGAALPEVITRGAGGEGGPVLAYASAATGFYPRPRLQPGRVPAPAQGTASAATPSAAGRTGQGHSSEMQAEIRRLFNGPTVARNVHLRQPELRRFANFVAPPRSVVAGGFGGDGSNGLSTSRFQGAAVVAVPVVAMVSGPAPLRDPL
ncbi:DUF882 domain-containing protein [Ancylobacter mangrovi]|uniref:DUF882 domain-containing protein n=1 Tax=Ancylobacter mangrovi TaxID=2972472 RepID=UPI002867E188|nr:DUF882 domain-containing protein [Ancylobacter mangrovi]